MVPAFAELRTSRRDNRRYCRAGRATGRTVDDVTAIFQVDSVLTVESDVICVDVPQVQHRPASAGISIAVIGLIVPGDWLVTEPPARSWTPYPVGPAVGLPAM